MIGDHQSTGDSGASGAAAAARDGVPAAALRLAFRSQRQSSLDSLTSAQLHQLTFQFAPTVARTWRCGSSVAGSAGTATNVSGASAGASASGSGGTYATGAVTGVASGASAAAGSGASGRASDSGGCAVLSLHWLDAEDLVMVLRQGLSTQVRIHRGFVLLLNLPKRPFHGASLKLHAPAMNETALRPFRRTFIHTLLDIFPIFIVVHQVVVLDGRLSERERVECPDGPAPFAYLPGVTQGSIAGTSIIVPPVVMIAVNVTD